MISRWIMIVKMSAVLNRTVVDSDWRFNSLYRSHLQSELFSCQLMLLNSQFHWPINLWCYWLWRLQNVSGAFWSVCYSISSCLLLVVVGLNSLRKQPIFCGTIAHISPRNDIWWTSAEIQYVTTQICVVLLTGGTLASENISLHS